MAAQPNSRRKKFAAGIAIPGLIVAGAGFLYLFLTPKTYIATAKVQLMNPGWHPSRGDTIPISPGAMQRECEMIRSAQILDLAAQRLASDERPPQTTNPTTAPATDAARAHLQGMLQVSVIPASFVIQIQATSARPEEAAQAANTVAQVYHDSRLGAHDQVPRDLALVAQELNTLNARIDEAETALNRSNMDFALNQTNLSQVYGPKSYELLTAKYRELNAEYSTQNGFLAQLKAMDREQRAAALAPFEDRTNSILLTCMARLQKAETDLAAIAMNHGSSSPDVKSARLIVEQLRQQISESVDAIVWTRERNLAALQTDLDELGREAAGSITNLSRVSEANPAYGEALKNLERLRADRDILKDRINLLEKPVKPLPQTLTTEILELADAPTNPSQPDGRIGIGVICGGAGAVLAGLLLLITAPRPGPPQRA